MGISMTAEEIAELDKMLAGEPMTDEPTQQMPEVEAKAETPEPEAKAPEPQEAPKVEAEQPKQEAPSEDIRPVPYTRFKEVNSALRDAKARADELEAKLAAFAQAAKEPESEDDWLDRVLGDKKEEPASDVPAWAKSMQSELQAIQAERAQLLLDRRLAEIQRDYPDIPEPVILQGIANGQAVEDIAASWDYVAKLAVESRAKRFPAQEQPKPDVAPRLPASKGPVNAPEPPAHAKTWSENSKRVQEWFKTQQ